MSTEKGNLSIDSENIFPIIKKWLYSDHDIFIREMVSNGCDAITKLKKLDGMGEFELPEKYKPAIEVIANSKEKTLKFIDNGIGMTGDEVKEYINQIAFSGAADFLAKYKDKTSEDQIIGHFGLGFYSAFMVADKVTIDTLSFEEGSQAVHWESEGGTTFEMSDIDKDSFGTAITLYLNEDSNEFSNEYRVKEVLQKYCSFMPVEIFFKKEDAEQEYETIDVEDIKEDDVVVEKFTEPAKTEEKEKEDGTKETVEVSPAKEKAKINKRPVPINETHPLWGKHPNEVTEEEYKEFYRSVFHDYKEPLFWIHLNMDYPFNLKGILYFPKLNTEYDNLEGVIKLYNNQVFIADNIKEVIPEFLMLLKGVIDCPELPLNVSRSALQNDGFVKKISDYITKKVADKLSGMYKTEKESYEKYWDDISPFIKYGCLKDDKFREKIKDYIIYKDLNGKYLTIEEYLKEAKGENKDSENKDSENKDSENKDSDNKDNEGSKDKADENKDTGDEKDSPKETGDAVDADGNKVEAEVVDEGGSAAGSSENSDSDDDAEEKEKPKDIVYYVTDMVQQSQYVNMFKEEGMNAVILTHNIDQPFISQLEQTEENIKFQRIDADLTDSFKEETGEDDLKDETEALKKMFQTVLGKDKLEVKVEKLKNANVSSMITLSEESRRMQDMMKMYSMGGEMDMDMFGGGQTLILNANNQLVKYLFEHPESEHKDTMCRQLYDLAMLAHKPLAPEAMTQFINRSNEILGMLAV